MSTAGPDDGPQDNGPQDDGPQDDTVDVEARVAALYGGALDAFVAQRDGLARTLRSAGRREEAATVKALKKPRAVAWALNAGRQADAATVTELGWAVDAVSEAQTGGGDIREALATLRAAERDLVEAAERAAQNHGRPVDETELASAVRAVVADPDALADLRAGRLVDVPPSGGLGLAMPGGAPARPARPGASKRPAAPQRRAPVVPDDDTAAITAARRAMAKADRAAEAATSAARGATAAADAAEHEAKVAEREAASAQRRADERQRTAERTRARADAAAARRDEAVAELAAAKAALRALEG
jgi:hypothetical protein